MKYVVQNNINAAASTYTPTTRPTKPPPSQRTAFPAKKENFDNGHLNTPNNSPNSAHDRALPGPEVRSHDIWPTRPSKDEKIHGMLL
jgi:hypothetical protein